MTESFDPADFVRQRMAARKAAQKGKTKAAPKGKTDGRQLSRNEHPGTAKVSGYKTALTLNESQEKVLAWMKTLAAGTKVTGSMADKALGKDAHKRLPELERQEAIELAGTVYDSETKRNVRAYRMTERQS